MSDQQIIISALKLYAGAIDDDLRKRYGSGEHTHFPEQIARDERLRDRAIALHREIFAAQMTGEVGETK